VEDEQAVNPEDLLIEDDEPAEQEDETADETAEDEAKDETETEVEPVPMPVSWSKEDAEAWKALPPETQAIVARREGERDKYVREQGRKSAETQKALENEARERIAQQADDYAARLSVYAQQNLPAPPDQRLLYTGNPDDVLSYQRQDAAYRAATAQQHQLQQEVARAQQQASEVRRLSQEQEIAADRERLSEQLPEWFDPSAGPKLQQELQSIGAELGYPPELMAQAGATDILALKAASEWKAKADKWDALNAKKMAAVRSAKGLPKMARPGVTQGKGAQAANASARREQALESFAQTRSGDAAAALLLERKR
jgi:hypothetical protein